MNMKRLTGILLILLMITMLTGFKSDYGSDGGLFSFFFGDNSDKTAELVSGAECNGTMHELAGDDFNFEYYYQFGYDPKLEPSNIEYFKRADSMNGAQKQRSKKISTELSEYPVYVWFEKDTLYFYSKAGTIYLNENAKGMFYHLSVKTLDVSEFDARNVRDMYGMFLDCRKLKSVDVSGWNTSQVTDMRKMFQHCSKLEKLNLSKWKTGHVINMESMFSDCRSLTTLKAADWNTANVTDFLHMFYDCRSLKDADFSKWNTGSVLEMTEMFENCFSLSSKSVHSCDSWDCSGVKRSGFFRMFRKVESGHPKWKGAWDEEGTFTPSKTDSGKNHAA